MAVYTLDQLKALWIQAGGSPQTADAAAQVALATSKGNSDYVNNSAPNGTVGRGLWNISSTYGPQSTTDPLLNARAAVAISNGGLNWQPFGVANPTTTAPTQATQPVSNPFGGGGSLLGVNLDLSSGLVSLLGIDKWFSFLAYATLCIVGTSTMGFGLLLMLLGSRRFRRVAGAVVGTVAQGAGFGLGANILGNIGLRPSGSPTAAAITRNAMNPRRPKPPPAAPRPKPPKTPPPGPGPTFKPGRAKVPGVRGTAVGRAQVLPPTQQLPVVRLPLSGGGPVHSPTSAPPGRGGILSGLIGHSTYPPQGKGRHRK